MLNEEVTRAEIKKIVHDELDKIIKAEVDKQIAASIKKGAGEKEVKAIVKDSLNNLYKFMWVKRNTWNNDIK